MSRSTSHGGRVANVFSLDVCYCDEFFLRILRSSVSMRSFVKDYVGLSLAVRKNLKRD